VILGSAAIKNPCFVKEMLTRYGEKIVIGLDAKDGYVATEGWVETSTVKATVLGSELAEAGAKTFIFTDIATDGMLSGPNVGATAELASVTGASVIASGGVSSMVDLQVLREFAGSGIVGAIVGKAIYTSKISLASAIEEVK
jgi:phosphoribosylformimino-5-aminoimidazole carboxamide ribotide isomerase